MNLLLGVFGVPRDPNLQSSSSDDADTFSRRVAVPAATIEFSYDTVAGPSSSGIIVKFCPFIPQKDTIRDSGPILCFGYY